MLTLWPNCAPRHTAGVKCACPTAQSAAVELVVSDDLTIAHWSFIHIAESSLENPWGVWLWVRRGVLSTQRVGCSVVMGPIGRGHLTAGYRRLQEWLSFSDAWDLSRIWAGVLWLYSSFEMQIIPLVQHVYIGIPIANNNLTTSLMYLLEEWRSGFRRWKWRRPFPPTKATIRPIFTDTHTRPAVKMRMQYRQYPSGTHSPCQTRLTTHYADLHNELLI